MPLPRFAIALTLACSTSALAQHSDIDLAVVTLDDGTQIVDTGTSDFFNPGAPVQRGVRVFPADFGEGALQGITDDPGFNARNGALPGGAFVAFDLLDAVRIWNPATSDFDTIANNTISLGLFGTSRTTSILEDGFVQGFDFSVVDTDGSLHQHLNYSLNPAPTQGVFLLTMRIRVNTPNVAPSEPMYLVFNNGAPEAMHDDAVAYVESLLEPCPGDATGDNIVDLADLNLVLANFGAGPGGDTNGDGNTDLADLNLVLANFGEVCG